MRWGNSLAHDTCLRSLSARPKWIVLAGIVLAVGLESGCVSTGPGEWIRNGLKVGPNYCRPDAPVSDAWISADDRRIENRSLPAWWQVFQDPTLDRLINTAYAQNLNLRTLGARVLEARLQRSIAAGSLFPQAQQATGQYSRIGLSHNTFNNPAQISALAPTPLPPGIMIGNYYSDWSAGFNLSWELDFWGRFRRNIESADAKLDASIENYDAVLVTLLADVATNHVQYRVAQQRIKIAHDNVRIQEGVLALAAERLRVGTATELDIKQAATVLEATRASVPAQEIALGQANDQLCILLGLPPRDLAEQLGEGVALGANPVPNTPSWVAAGIPADLLRRRPDIRSAERQVAIQSAQIGVAEADLYPAIAINGTVGFEAADLSQLFESRSLMGTITPGFRWNILNYGRISNNVRLQQARTQELIWAYQNQVLMAAREAQTSLRGFLRSQEQAADLARSVAAAVDATQLGVKQYTAGVIAFNTVFQLETTQVLQQEQLVLTQGNVALNLINAYRALGGGWEIRLGQDSPGATSAAGALSPTALPPDHKPEPLPVPKPPGLGGTP
jgi:NodT family efflux transporter outer membrane factor (OMF) lipoprotein